ncbi:MAG: prolyl oligopeptidase family serine peptidase [Acidimicrobiia bacterium]
MVARRGRRRRRLVRRRVAGGQRLPHARVALPARRHRRRRAGAGPPGAGALRRRRPRHPAALRHQRRRHPGALLRGRPPRPRRSGAHAARRLRRLRGAPAAGLRAGARSCLAGGGAHVRARQHPRRRRVRARWHQAGLRERRPRVYEDFEAVARDLVDRGVTTPAQLGCTGGSNGGLLVGNMYVRSPELWGAIVCQVPLLDMRRYHELLAGASWMAEYGDPDDPDDWAFLQSYSPYHLLDADRSYPPLLLTTSTRDDRVHPGHARKMAARAAAIGADVAYWENVEGGHGGAADADQQATMQALLYVFLGRHLS